ncbi:MAG: 50S ribosomal protein L25/general stress protein Ctc [Methylotenera sp. 24-45-7]|jgi:large subunit ribosomal protein L25|nr:MAG: 50S ribosomal protein L25/general stress protein Ctc [Mehylophilales bacterium 35-46-6]OYZ40237.1 MAG: 50S ribosomal protein L25/general stress protein Ctc [Methylotenera sp. 24-45-7]OZA09444.1 MAG: 50S ribosomal protein L25/general stress protein Ctc [Methylotenera sp. 17-45-7]OZA50455.1 MAG: 50S ribosomal protein L25/general stress protein Ctc [Methylophilales bacterium 39-45-7]HQS37800.1 50S ribosomal protein L25/general stress protein Ctc [Methylotenera sp.]
MTIEINAVKRDAKGTGASRRLRHAGAVPGVVYGGGKDAITIELNAKELFMEFRHEAFHASVLTLILDGKKESVLLRDFQMHPVRNTIQHVDFQRVSATEKIHVKVPFHFINADVAPGVKLGGGIVAHVQTEADVSCLAKDLPEFIEVDVASLEIGHSIHLSQIKLPKGVEFVQLAHGDDAAVASIAKTRGGVSDAAAAEEETPAA